MQVVLTSCIFVDTSARLLDANEAPAICSKTLVDYVCSRLCRELFLYQPTFIEMLQYSEDYVAEIKNQTMRNQSLGGFWLE